MALNRESGMRRVRLGLVLGLVVTVAIVVAGFRVQQSLEGQRLFSQVASIVDRHFVDSLGASGIFERATRGLVAELNDPYAELIPPSNREAFERSTTGRYGGIGALLEVRTGNRVHIERTFPNTPARSAGVVDGDRIVAINGESVEGWDLARVSGTMRGTPGTPVSVTFERPGVERPVVLTLTRAIVHIPAVPFAMVLESGVGYIPLQTFNENAAEEVEEAVLHLRREGATGIVLDMRGNGGGILDQSLSVSSLFLPSDRVITRVKARGMPDEVDRTIGNAVDRSTPLVVLVDGASASATEIVAGALQDHDRALVVGTRTFGKGVVQQVFPLDGGWAFKLTTGAWYTPSGRSLHRPREMRADGSFAEVSDSAMAADSLTVYRSSGGRALRGGGGIFPDVVLAGDTVPTREREWLRLVAPSAGAIVSVLNEDAGRLRSEAGPGFVVRPEWVNGTLGRLAAAGVRYDSSFADAARAVVTRELDERISRMAFGDSGVMRRGYARDTQLMHALSLLRGRTSQDALFSAASASSRR